VFLFRRTARFAAKVFMRFFFSTLMNFIYFRLERNPSQFCQFLSKKK